MTDKQPEALIRADELETIGAESSLARAMAAHTIRLLYKENEALRARLAQPEQEPVAWISAEETWLVPKLVISDTPKDGYKPVYTAPPQREWQGLTDEEITETLKRFGLGERAALARAIEAKLKEKNNG